MTHTTQIKWELNLFEERNNVVTKLNLCLTLFSFSLPALGKNSPLHWERQSFALRQSHVERHRSLSSNTLYLARVRLLESSSLFIPTLRRAPAPLWLTHTPRATRVAPSLLGADVLLVKRLICKNWPPAEFALWRQHVNPRVVGNLFAQNESFFFLTL